MASVLIVGSGLAGLLAAIRATDAGHRVTLVTKSVLAESNTRYAQGGIAAALFPDDSADAHMLDTLRAGAGLCDAAAVRALCDEGPARVRDLIRFGVTFDHDRSGLMRGREAAHSRARVLHAGGDATGAAIETALVTTVRRRSERRAGRGAPNAGSLDILENTMLADLVVSDGRITGAILQGGRVRRTLSADFVILATGGAGALYPFTTNPAVATGDGVAAAWRAGASVADLEFYQFHPTALAVPGTPLVTEAVRGEGATLLSASGERFMRTVHPDAELAPRDIVARAIARQMAEQDGEPVLLDATGLGAEQLAERFPTVTAACLASGLDWTREPVPVSPAAHYWMGGVVTDLWGRTTLPGLFAVGEVARSGAHGANRLASNSLLEAAVFADRAVRALSTDDGDFAQRAGNTPDAALTTTGISVDFSRRALQRLMWDAAGVFRSGEALAAAAGTLSDWVDAGSASVGVSPGGPIGTEPMAAQEDANLLLLGHLTVTAALAREESRGAHFRDDFPFANPALAHSPSWTRPESRVIPLPKVEEALAC